jgi:hypothetical protein
MNVDLRGCLSPDGLIGRKAKLPAHHGAGAETDGASRRFPPHLAALSRRTFLRVGGTGALAIPLVLGGPGEANAQLWPLLSGVVVGAMTTFANNVAADLAHEALQALYQQFGWKQRQVVETRQSAAQERQYTTVNVTNVYKVSPRDVGRSYFWVLPHVGGYSAVVPVFNPDIYNYRVNALGSEEMAAREVPFLDGPTTIGLAAAAGQWSQFKVYASGVTAQDGLVPLWTEQDMDPFPAWNQAYQASKLYRTSAGYVEVYYDGLASWNTRRQLGEGFVRVRGLDTQGQAHFDRYYPIKWAH